MGQNDASENKRYQPRKRDQAPGTSTLHAEGKHNSHDARCDKSCAKGQRQERRRKKRIFESDKAGEDIKRADEYHNINLPQLLS